MNGNESDKENEGGIFTYSWLDGNESDKENEFEANTDPMRIPPDVFDRIMATDIETIFAGRNYTRLTYTSQLTTEQNSIQSSVEADLPPTEEVNADSLQPVQNGVENEETRKPLGESASVSEIKKQDNETKRMENELEPNSDNSLSDRNDSQFHYSRIYRSQRGRRGRGDTHRSGSTRWPYPRYPVMSTSQSQQSCTNLSQPQMPCLNGKDDWPCLNPPRQPYQPRGQVQDGGRKFTQQRGKRRFSNRGKFYFNSTRQGSQHQKKCAEEKESKDLSSKSKTQPKYQEQKQIVQETVPIQKTSLKQETTLTPEITPTQEVTSIQEVNTTQLPPQSQEIDESRQEFKNYNGNRQNTNKSHREVKLQNHRDEAEQGQSQHAYSNAASPTANAQPMFHSFQHPGNAPQQNDAPNQSRFLFQRKLKADPCNRLALLPNKIKQVQPSRTEERPNNRLPEMNQGPRPVQLTREQYQMQAQYQQIFLQQRQWFYHLQYQQQQQFLFLQTQQQQMFHNQQLTIWQQLMHAQHYTFNYQGFASVYGPPAPRPPGPSQLPPRPPSSLSQTQYFSPRNYQHQPNHDIDSSRYHQQQEEQHQPQHEHQQQEEQ